MRGAERVTPELELALLLLVFDGVEEGRVVGGPDDGADALDFAGRVSPVSRSLMWRVYWRKPVVSVV